MLEHSSVPQERYFPTTTIPTLRHNAAQVTSTIKPDNKFHFFFSFFLKVGWEVWWDSKETKVRVEKSICYKT